VSRLPRITAAELVGALKRLGFVEARQTGSHLVLTRENPNARVVVPMHPGRTLRLGTLKAIVDEGGVGVDELLGVL
jgi:predicted RNA binding protein YcfA (HicA-like mRNA interferase family)